MMNVQIHDWLINCYLNWVGNVMASWSNDKVMDVLAVNLLDFNLGYISLYPIENCRKYLASVFTDTLENSSQIL